VGWFAEHGHTVCLLADVPVQQPWPGIKLIDLSEKFYAPIIRFPVWTVWLKRFLRQWQPDILHAHRVNSAGWLVAASGYHPMVLTPWGSDVFVQPQRSTMARFLARYTLQRADLVTTNSHAMQDAVIKLGARPNCVRPVQFGVELDIFNPAPASSEQQAAFRQQYGIPAEGPRILSARAIRPIYNIQTILESIPQVFKRSPTATFLLLNYNVDPNYKSQLEVLVNDLGLERHVRWLQPLADRHALAELYRMSDVIVSVPSSDATPVSVLEAMACGRPVVCSDPVSVREFITSGKNGWLVPVGESQPLADAICDLLEHPGLSQAVGIEARRVVEQKFDYASEMEHLEKLYQGLVGGCQDTG
jgi:glycosyltransferase involved in cell wall biosynthesis